ncbi:MAG: rhodanese-like domain-containing protein [Clostridiales bacterium]|nr:rhodanese-like domain-containing protein [Clostridiales bacterium]
MHFFGSVEYLRKEDERLEKEGFTGKKIATFIVCDRMESYVSYIRKYRPDIFETVSKDENGVEKESIYTYDGLNEEDEKFLKIIEPEELYDKITNGENPYIIDTRGSMAFKNNNIKGSINITDTFFDEIIENGLPFIKETEVIMVCVDGKKTNRYSKFLNKKGLNVVSLKGGIMAWREKGLPIARNVMKLR